MSIGISGHLWVERCFRCDDRIAPYQPHICLGGMDARNLHTDDGITVALCTPCAIRIHADLETVLEVELQEGE